MNREINTLSIKGLLDKRFWVIIVFFMLTLPAYAVTNAFVVTGEVIDLSLIHISEPTRPY